MEVQDRLRERESEVQELHARAAGAEASLQKAQVELAERAEEAAKLRSEVAELEVKNAELKVERKQLEQQREEKESKGAQQQTEISQVRLQTHRNHTPIWWYYKLIKYQFIHEIQQIYPCSGAHTFQVKIINMLLILPCNKVNFIDSFGKIKHNLNSVFLLL